jgi:hypothetical protein
MLGYYAAAQGTLHTSGTGPFTFRCGLAKNS